MTLTVRISTGGLFLFGIVRVGCYALLWSDVLVFPWDGMVTVSFWALWIVGPIC